METTMTTAATPAPLTDRTPVLTDRGHATRSLYHFVHALRGLDAHDRLYVLELLASELAELPA